MKKVIAYILISAILFSTMEVALKTAGNHLDPLQLTFLRFLIGGVFLFPFALKEIKKLGTVFTKKDYTHMLLMGIVCICISMVFFQLGVDHSNASTAAVIFCINPMFTMLFAHFLTEEKMNRKKLIALGIGILGILFMVNPFHLSPGNTLMGASFSVLSALFFGLYSAMGRTSVRRLGGLTQTSISFIMGSVVMLPVLILFDRPIFSGITVNHLPMLFYISIMITGIGYLLYFLAMGESDAATASVVFFVKPGLAPIFAVIALGEVIEINGFIGIALIFVSSYINLREQKKKNGKIEKEIEVKEGFNEEINPK
ncbi:DMT family transporter [Sinanaerobacter chloroacetimidivorans]|uniref:DMT family transporter n=1 Tax=Sinanaerobacter chloroacetimidivorans TaxID=2818044 RepID=A0A8J7W446_9FIRM|nr:DMT family transporter [Sinanaerobacter chloroacetimidivorans]MBR0598993.1 DMT family transporter [Sinanaerobacter chloroacetimidivorans]